jgi:hypothetical protein
MMVLLLLLCFVRGRKGKDFRRRVGVFLLVHTVVVVIVIVVVVVAAVAVGEDRRNGNRRGVIGNRGQRELQRG